MGFSYLTVINNVEPYLPALLCLSALRFTRLSLSYQSFLSVSLRLAIPSLAYRLALVKPRLTLWTVCVGRLRVELRSTAYQTVALTVMLPPIARGCSAAGSKVLFHTGQLQRIAPIREFSFCNAHSQTSIIPLNPSVVSSYSHNFEPCRICRYCPDSTGTQNRCATFNANTRYSWQMHLRPMHVHTRSDHLLPVN